MCVAVSGRHACAYICGHRAQRVKIAVQMHHHTLVASDEFCIHICVSPSNDYTAVACSNNQAQLHSCISYFLISRRLSRPRVASRYSVQTSSHV